VGWFSRLFNWRGARSLPPGLEGTRKPETARKRRCRFEAMEQRRLLAITPVVIGATYIEDDSGHDLRGDTFEIKFEGGAPQTELSRIVIDTDHDARGYSVGDLIFDTSHAGLGTDEAVPFQIVSQVGISKVNATLEDGGMRLILDFEGFHAGDKLVFTVDVDEIQQFDPAVTDLGLMNEGVDPIASGVEFQSSTMTATFKAPHFYDANGTAEFRNVYDRLFLGTGLLRSEANPEGLPFDNYLGLRDRSTGAALPLSQRLLPVSVSGYVYHDTNDNGLRQSGEALIAGTPIRLEPLQTLEPQANITVVTDAQGFYKFEGISPGTYRIVETVQPAGLLDGKDTAGTIRGIAVGQAVNPGDSIESVILAGGDVGIEYNFGELRPGSIEGFVHLDLDQDCEKDAGESPIAGTKVELVDAAGMVIATTRTDELGRYRFEGLAPGEYSVRETQPNGFFHGGQTAGKAGGDSSVDDLISAITIGAGQNLVDYNFCEVPPSRLSGTVFQDGPDIETLNGTLPTDLSAIRDGKRTVDDRPIAGVVLELRNGIDGRPILGEQALPGLYPSGPIRTTTDAQGRYEFRGLRGRASYAVFEVHPEGFVDGIDTPGSTSGIAFNPGQVVPQFVLQTLAVQPRNDAIVRIPLRTGQSSEFNDFSEVRVTRLPPPPETIPPPPALPPETPRLSLATTRALPPPWLIVTPEAVPIYGAHPGMTWHLSVIDAGVPRGLTLPQSAEVEWTRTAFVLANEPWSTHRLDAGEWVITTSDQLTRRNAEDAEGRKIRLGMPGAIPIAGDFNGDGLCEVGVYFRGEWFIDLNGNGEWDDGDLWARLGDRQDLPVVGDWDGDGKDDIGIYGPEWQGDRRAIAAEPGLPDLTNRPKDKPKNVPPNIDEATDGHRLLKLTRNGRPRADLIDHVFRYGRSQDLPIAGDWDGDGIDSIGTFCDGYWMLDYNGDGRNRGQEYAASFGQAGDLPVVGDFDGDGIDEIGVFRAGTWYIDSNHNRELDAHDKVFQLGGAGDRPVVGDWDGDGIDDPGVYHDAPPAPVPPGATTARN